jgi:tRNA(Ile)-lysidine synthase
MIDFTARLLDLTGPRPRILLAYSGGVDSTVLAHALVRGRRRLGSLRFVHVDHGLQPASRTWSRRCASQARSWRVPFLCLRAQVRKGRQSPEAAARDARYALLEQSLQPGEVLVTAQHRDDQIETLLLQLLRGTGVAGLAGMPRLARFGRGHIARPLLEVARQEIEAYARAVKLQWIEDPTNDDVRYSRNFVRHRLMPLIREHWPGADRALARTAANLAETLDLLDERARADLSRAADGAGLSTSALRALPAARRRNAVRRYIARAGVEVPDARQLREITETLLSAREDAQPEVRWAGGIIRRRSGRLELRADSEESRSLETEFSSKSWEWEKERELIVSSGETLALEDDPHGGIDLGRLPKALELRPRRGGEKLRPGPRARLRPLKKLLQDARLTPEQREGLPLLFAGERLIAAGDRWIDASVAANVKSPRRARLIWKRRPTI